MSLEQIETSIADLNNKMEGINNWIRNNPHITDPNVYEIMDCNVQYAECISRLNTYYKENGYPEIETKEGTRVATKYDLPTLHPSIGDCFFKLVEMENLRKVTTHPFLTQPEPNSLLCSIKASAMAAEYEIPNDPAIARIKRETICKSMSVPFYIWQVKRTEPDYQYDNQEEFSQMQEMFDLYKTTSQEQTGTCQYENNITALFSKIDKDYKYSITKDSSTKKF